MIENLEERIAKAKTQSFKTIFTSATNHHNTMFGGAALAIMDDISFITATRFSHQKYVTVSTQDVSFIQPIPNASIIEAIGEVEKVGNSSIVIKVTVYAEEMYSEKRTKAIEGFFKMVAVDDNGKPEPIV